MVLIHPEKIQLLNSFYKEQTNQQTIKTRHGGIFGNWNKDDNIHKIEAQQFRRTIYNTK